MTSADSPPDAPLVASVQPLVPAWRVDRTFDYAVPESLAGRVRAGSLVRVALGHRKVRGIVVGLEPPPPPTDELSPILSLVIDVPLASPPLAELFDWLARRYVVPRARAFERIVPARVRVRPAETGERAEGPEPKLVLGYDGGGALLDAIEGGRSGTYLLRSVLGEDRAALVTELVAAAGRARDGAALVCVPEVRYGSITIDGLSATWPGLARVDTAQPEPERAAAWLGLAEGAPIGAGGRAAVLAPAPSLRLLVVDEEHHRSY